MLLSWMEIAIAIGIARTGRFAARGASFEATMAESLTWKPRVEWGSAARNRPGQAPAAIARWRMIEKPAQEIMTMSVALLAGWTFRRKDRWRKRHGRHRRSGSR